MSPQEALQILAQVQIKFVGSGQDHQAFSAAREVLTNVVTDSKVPQPEPNPPKDSK